MAERPSFRAELRDFFVFVRRPAVGPRLAGQGTGNGIWRDWFPAMSIKRLFQWALFMWAINLLFFGPIAVMAAGMGGATHRLNVDNIPWMTALLWAPLAEELVFRYGLRRLKWLFLMLPLGVAAMLSGPGLTGGLYVCAFLLLAWAPLAMAWRGARRPMPWAWRCRYLHHFPWAFHLSSIAFSGVHLYNFNLGQTPWWLLPLLVMPQWVTGMVLGWLRVRRGVGASIVLHAVFNGGPLLLVWLALQAVPDMAM